MLIGFLTLISIYILPKLSKLFAQSHEFLFLFSIGWGLGLAALFHYIGFSMDMEALIAGVTLSASPYHYEISSKMKSLRDFVIILFFLLLSSQMAFGFISHFISPSIIFSLFFIICNLHFVLLLMVLLG